MVRLTSLALPPLLFLLSAAAPSPSQPEPRRPLPQPERRRSGSGPVPPFVLQFAPVSRLYSGERYWPSDVSVHLAHVAPEVNFARVAPAVTMQNLSALAPGDADVFLTATDDPTKDPAWITSDAGRPDASGFSAAPATIVLVDKPELGGVLDAFFFYFYSFDYGGKVLDIPFGDHVGDWEHVMVRFTNGTPVALALSAHTGGSAYTFDAVEKESALTTTTTDTNTVGQPRPRTYIATGTHANYATAGKHCHDLPAELLCDHTDAAGPLWDPVRNYRAFWFDGATGAFSVAGAAGPAAEEIGAEGAGWLQFRGGWGDERYRLLEHGQYCVPVPGGDPECRYVSGPTGPIAKNLMRTAVCQHEDECTIATTL